MPCRDETHIHTWPTEGILEICKCEIFCGFCTGDAAKVVYEHPWQLRGHVREHAQTQGLALKVSPQPPKTHVNTTSTKRKLAEVESSEGEEDEDSDEVQDDSTKDEDYEDGTKRGKSKAKPRSSTTKPPSNPSAGPDDEYVDTSQAPLRLRAKPDAKAKKDSMESQTASFQPVGPKTGPPSPKRTKQAPVMGLPASIPMNNFSGLAPHVPPSQARLQYLQRLQDSAGATSASMNINGQGFAGHPQQNTNNVQRPVGNMGFPTNNMRPHPGGMGSLSGNIGPLAGGMGPFPGNIGPRPGNLGPLPGNMGPHPGSMGPPMNNMRLPMSNMSHPAGNTGPPMGNTGLLSGNIGLFSGSIGFPTGSRGPRSDSMEISPRTKVPPRVTMGPQPRSMGPPMDNMRPPMSNTGPPMHPQPTNMPGQNFNRIALPIPTPHERMRYLTTSLLTQNLNEDRVITLYQGEIEHLRTLQLKRMYTSVMQQVQNQWMQQQNSQNHAVHPVQMGMQQGGLQQGQQMGGQQPGSRVPLGVQQPGHRGFPGGQQPAAQYVADQQAATQPPAAMRSGAVPVVVDPVLPPQQTPSAEEKDMSHNQAD